MNYEYVQGQVFLPGLPTFSVAATDLFSECALTSNDLGSVVARFANVGTTELISSAVSFNHMPARLPLYTFADSQGVNVVTAMQQAMTNETTNADAQAYAPCSAHVSNTFNGVPIAANIDVTLSITSEMQYNNCCCCCNYGNASITMNMSIAINLNRIETPPVMDVADSHYFISSEVQPNTVVANQIDYAAVVQFNDILAGGETHSILLSIPSAEWADVTANVVFLENDNPYDVPAGHYLLFDAATMMDENGLASVTGSLTVPANVVQGFDGDRLQFYAVSQEGGSTYVSAEAAQQLLVGALSDDALMLAQNYDMVFTLAGNDVVDVANYHAAYLDGGEGNDTISFAQTAAAINVDLADANDALLNFENVIGSHYDDVLAGDAASNRLEGGAGDDIFLYSAGSDHTVGGVGSDTLDFSVANYPVIVDLLGNVATTVVASGYGDMQTLESIENVVGTIGNDFFVSSSSDNVIDAGAGDDVYVYMYRSGAPGGDGSDTFNAGTGYDILNMNSYDSSSLVWLDTDAAFEMSETSIFFTEPVSGSLLLYNGETLNFSELEQIDLSAIDLSHLPITSAQYAVADYSQAGTGVIVDMLELADQGNPARIVISSDYDDVVRDDPFHPDFADGDNVIISNDGDDVIFYASGNDEIHAGNGADALVIQNNEFDPSMLQSFHDYTVDQVNQVIHFTHAEAVGQIDMPSGDTVNFTGIEQILW